MGRTRFHHQRLPLIILVCGTACVGKSTIATQLAQRLNLPNILQVSHSPAISSAKSNSYIWLWMWPAFSNTCSIDWELINLNWVYFTNNLQIDMHCLHILMTKQVRTSWWHIGAQALFRPGNVWHAIGSKDLNIYNNCRAWYYYSKPYTVLAMHGHITCPWQVCGSLVVQLNADRFLKSCHRVITYLEVLGVDC